MWAGSRKIIDMQIRSVGIDLGKMAFHLVALRTSGRVLLRKKFTQRQLITFTANIQISLIGMEACAGAHFLSRILRAQGHDVKLIPAQFVRAFVKRSSHRATNVRDQPAASLSARTRDDLREDSVQAQGSAPYPRER